MERTSRLDKRSDNRAERRLTAEYLAARALAESATLAEATPKVLQAICDALDWEHGALWNVDPDAEVLRCVEIWHRPDVEFPQFEAISRTTRFRRGIGLPGRVWASSQPAWIPDVVQDTNFPRAPIASREGLHAAFGFPILIQDRVVGVMEFFSREIREPDEDLLKMLSTVGIQIGQVVERRRAEEDLQRFFALSLDMLCVAGFDGYFKRLNPAWERVLGYRREELLARPYLDFIHPDDRDRTLAEAKKVAGGVEVVSFENRYRCKDGSYRWLQWAGSPFPDQQLIYAVARDVSERRRAEETLARYVHDLDVARGMHEEDAARLAQLVKELEVARRRAEQATEAKGDFLANMSHEVRTPLNAVIGMTDLALDTRLTVEQREYLTSVKEAADWLRVIVNDILDLSKIEARKLELDRMEFGLRDTVEDTVRVLALRAVQKGLELACHVAPELPDHVVGDRGRLRQVIMNLLSNAIKFTERGEVVLDVNADSVANDHVRLHFTVTDTGIGIPASKQALIFEAFAQADSSTTRKYGGTGLGLAIASRLVELMGGTIWVESEVDRGSTFHFTANVARHTPATAVRRTSESVTLEGLRVLVVDDNRTNRRILEEMLTNWRMRPVAVESGAAALATLEEAESAGDPFALVVTDHQMPGMDGLALARKIRRNASFAKMSVLLLTSLARPGDMARGRKAGVAAYLTKPVKQSELLDTILTLFGKPRPRRRDLAAPAALTRARRPGRAKRLRILVAEDNPVNRKLVVRILEKRGHAVVTAAHGRAAFAALEEGRGFDLVLMDVQMPEMDGFETTAAIRRWEEAGRHMPIVAMTAHAMAGDREQCLRAGMDAYVSKPIHAPELIDIVERLASGQVGQTANASHGQTSHVVIDEALALRRVDGDRRLFAELVALFLEDAPKSVKQIRQAAAAGDGEALRAAAHTVKGAVAIFGAARATGAAARLETMGREGHLTGVDAACQALERELARVREALVAAVSLGRRRRAAKPRQAAARTGSRRQRR